MMDRERMMLATARAALDAAQAALETAGLLLDTYQPDACQHLRRKSMSTMTEPNAWYCPDCRQQGATT